MNPTPTSALEFEQPLEEDLPEPQLAESPLELIVAEQVVVVELKPKSKKSRPQRAAQAIAETAITRIYQLRKPARIPRTVPRGSSKTWLATKLPPAPEALGVSRHLRHKPSKLPAYLPRGENGVWLKPQPEPAVEVTAVCPYPRRKPPRLPFTLPRGSARIQFETNTTPAVESAVIREKSQQTAVRLPPGFSREGAKTPLAVSIAAVSTTQTAAALPGSGCNVNTKRIVEAILFAADKPLSVKQIQLVFPELEQPDTLEIQDAIESISQDYLTRPIGLQQLASGWRFQVKEGMAYWVSRLFEEKPPRYSRAMLETIAIIAYRQPVTRGEIEDIRGVAVSSSIIHTLLEREWIRVIAHKEAPGRPALYGTTKQFLDYFNLSALGQLPTLEELAQFDFSTLPQQLTQQDTSERPQTYLSAAIEARASGEETQQAAFQTEDSGQQQ